MHQLGFGTIALVRSSLRHVTSVVTTLENGHKKPAWKNFHRPGSHVSPACLATYLTWLQAGRLKSPRDKYADITSRPSRQGGHRITPESPYLRGLDEFWAVLRIAPCRSRSRPTPTEFCPTV